VLVTFGLFTLRKTIITKMSYNVGQSIVAKSPVLCVGDIRSLRAAKTIITKMSYNVGQSIVAKRTVLCVGDIRSLHAA
jgi:hypothetical protein